MTGQRPRKTKGVEPAPSTKPTAEPIRDTAPATATPAADNHQQASGRGVSPDTDLTGVEFTAPVEPATRTEGLTPDPDPARTSPMRGEAQPRGSRPPRQPRPTKLARLQAMLRAPAGASLPALREATGWQAHTLRAALTRLRHAGHTVKRGRSDEGVTTYRIAEGAAEAATAAGAAPKPSTETATESAERGRATRGGTSGRMARRGAASGRGDAPSPKAGDSA